MGPQNLQFFKFATALIDNGLWSRMSTAARTLYPVLLRFSDRDFKPVFPGAKTLLKLTGFKQKSSIRKARQELEELGLISYSEGTGRRNTCYHFRFDWLSAPRGGMESTPWGMRQSSSGDVSADPQYNQIHISINNNPVQYSDETEDRELELLRERFDPVSFRLAESECRLAGLKESAENIKKILYRNRPEQRLSWESLLNFLSSRISSGSLEMIKAAYLGDSPDGPTFRERLPEHLKKLLSHHVPNAIFETTSLHEYTSDERYRKAGG